MRDGALRSEMARALAIAYANVIATVRRSGEHRRVIFADVAVTTTGCFSVAGLWEGVQQRIGAHKAQADAQRREEVRVHDVRQGVQAAGPPVSTDQRISRRAIATRQILRDELPISGKIAFAFVESAGLATRRL